MDKKWKKFERVVTAIHLAVAKGATVTWDEDIDGRQFDVTIRFKAQFYDYLVLIECKDWKTRVKAEHVEAFVTKSADQNRWRSPMDASTQLNLEELCFPRCSPF